MIDVMCVFGAGVTTLSQDTLESRSAVGRFCTVGLLGAVVTSGKWYWEITPRCPGSAMQVAAGEEVVLLQGVGLTHGLLQRLKITTQQSQNL